jgi:hypothetical protein
MVESVESVAISVAKAKAKATAGPDATEFIITL